jgi:NADH-quinone oxidoreductase subunit J
MIDTVFLICAAVCILSAVLIVSQKNPVYSVVYMLPFFVSITVVFVLLQAAFLGAIQMIVYGGAILVVFLFVIMLINLKPEELADDFSIWHYSSASVLVGALGALILIYAQRGATPEMETAFAKPALAQFGSMESLAAPLFKQQIMPFELVSILIVVAILGAVLLSKKRV